MYNRGNELNKSFRINKSNKNRTQNEPPIRPKTCPEYAKSLQKSAPSCRRCRGGLCTTVLHSRFCGGFRANTATAHFPLVLAGAFSRGFGVPRQGLGTRAAFGFSRAT